jgi:hypothetical protein
MFQYNKNTKFISGDTKSKKQSHANSIRRKVSYDKKKESIIKTTTIETQNKLYLNALMIREENIKNENSDTLNNTDFSIRDSPEKTPKASFINEIADVVTKSLDDVILNLYKTNYDEFINKALDSELDALVTLSQEYLKEFAPSDDRINLLINNLKLDCDKANVIRRFVNESIVIHNCQLLFNLDVKNVIAILVNLLQKLYNKNNFELGELLYELYGEYMKDSEFYRNVETVVNEFQKSISNSNYDDIRTFLSEFLDLCYNMYKDKNDMRIKLYLSPKKKPTVNKKKPKDRNFDMPLKIMSSLKKTDTKTKRNNPQTHFINSYSPVKKEETRIRSMAQKHGKIRQTKLDSHRSLTSMSDKTIIYEFEKPKKEESEEENDDVVECDIGCETVYANLTTFNVIKTLTEIKIWKGLHKKISSEKLQQKYLSFAEVFDFEECNDENNKTVKLILK